MEKYKDSLYPDKINDLIDNDGQLTESGKSAIDREYEITPTEMDWTVTPCVFTLDEDVAMDILAKKPKTLIINKDFQGFPNMMKMYANLILKMDDNMGPEGDKHDIVLLTYSTITLENGRNILYFNFGSTDGQLMAVKLEKSPLNN